MKILSVEIIMILFNGLGSFYKYILPTITVRLNDHLCRDSVVSDDMILNTGASQACIPSHFIFFTNEPSCNSPKLTFIEYADDLVLVGCLKHEHSLSQYYLQIESLIV